MANWPASLPRPLASSASYVPQANTIRTEVVAGPAKTRRRSTSMPTDVNFTLALSPAQRQTLDDFVFYTLAEVLPFNWMDFRLPDAPTNIAVYRFKSRPRYTPRQVGMRWEAAIELELLNRPSGAFAISDESFMTITDPDLGDITT